MKRIRKAVHYCLLFILMVIPAVVQAAESAGPLLGQTSLHHIDAYVREQFKAAGFPGGAYAVVNQGEITLAKGVGYADRDSKREAGPDTLYPVASVTKPMTAAVVLMLAAEGSISLDTPVAAYLPWFRYKDQETFSKVTVRHLLTHAAGVSRFSADGAIYQDVRNNRDSLENTVRALQTVKMNSEPGAIGQYCNTCFNVLGLVIEKVTGEPYTVNMQKRLFQPLGMGSTIFHPEEAKNEAGIAKEYGYLFGFSMEVTPYWREFGSSQAPEGGAYSSALDLARFAAAVMGDAPESFFASGGLEPYHIEGVAASDLKDAMYTESGFEATELHGKRILTKSGVGMGSSSKMILMPEHQVGIVLLVGETDGEASSLIAKGIASMMLGYPPASAEGLLNVMQVLGWISLALLVLSGVLVIWLIGSALRHFKGRDARKRSWPAFVRAAIYGILSVPIWYLLLGFRPTEAGFYGYPYDAAAALIALAAVFTSWAFYSAVVFFNRNTRASIKKGSDNDGR